MSRTDRLMRLMDSLRRLAPPVTAARLAAESGVSRRQLYRDIATLRAGGALIDGEAGVGYRLTEDPALPPQSFSRQGALARIVATLPERQAQQAHHAILHAFTLPPVREAPLVDLAILRAACWDEAELRIGYLDLQGRSTSRMIWPLGLSYTERSLMLLAHCRLRMDFRVFHVTRLISAERTGASFRPRRVALVRDYTAARQKERQPAGGVDFR